MKFSVALCTFNGQQFLEAQLQSLARQERLPDELVVCDDASTDNTCAIVRDFQKSAPFEIRLHINAQNEGSTLNFARAIGLCRGEAIALCDQDDVWLPHKLCLQEQHLQRGAGLVFSDAVVVERDLTPMPQSLWSRAGFDAARQTLMGRGGAFEVLLGRNVVTGATMAFSSRFNSLILPIPAAGPLIHDAWSALLLSAVAPVVALPEPLIWYRQHPLQQTGANANLSHGVLPVSHYQGHLRLLREVRSRLESWPLESSFSAAREASLKRISLQIAHLEARLNLPPRKAHRLVNVMRELVTGRYHRYSNGWRSATRDLLF